jgi:hypothetical protein
MKIPSLTVVAIVLAVCGAHSSQASDPKLPPELQAWWQSFRHDLDTNILKIRSREITTAYADARRVAGLFNLGEDLPRTFVRPATLKLWLRQFIWYDLEPSLAIVLAGLPDEHRAFVCQRLVSRRAPSIKVFSDLLHRGGWNADDGVMYLMPEHLQSYATVHHVVLHELLHCLVQDPATIKDQPTESASTYLCEGLTEYLTLRAEEARSKQTAAAVSGYEAEVGVVSWLLPIAAADLWQFYLRGPTKDSAIQAVIARQVVDYIRVNLTKAAHLAQR